MLREASVKEGVTEERQTKTPHIIGSLLARSLLASLTHHTGKGGERRVNRDEPDREADVITGRGTISERDEPREKDAEREGRLTVIASWLLPPYVP